MADGASLGTAWLDVVPSFKGLKQKISAEFGSSEVTSALTGATESWGSRIGSALSTHIGGALSSIGKIGLGGVAATLGGITAAITAHIPAAIEASDATDKFKSTLEFAGVDPSRIKQLTAAAQKYADQTVYDLSDIQSVTAQLAANGVKDFDRMAEAAGNVNAVAGGSKDTFKQVALALVQINGAGKLATQDWNQIAAAIPGASGKLQEAMKANGAYTGNFRDAMAKGQITAEEFNQALMDLGFTEVAQNAAKSASTFEGAWGNLEAALEKGLAGILDKTKAPLTDIINAVGDQLGPAFEGAGRYVDALTNKLRPLADAMKNGTLTVEDLAKTLGAATAGFAALAGAGTLLADPSLILGFFNAFPSAPQVSAIAQGIPDGLKEGLGRTPKVLESFADDLYLRVAYLGDDLRPRLALLGESFGGLPGRIAGALGSAAGAVRDKFSDVVNAVGQGVSNVVSRVGEAVSVFSGKMQSFLAPVKDFGLKIAAPFKAVGSKVGEWVAPIGKAFEGVGGKIASALGSVGSAGAQALQKAAGPLASAAEGLLSQVGMFLNPARFGKVLAFGGIITAAVAGLGALVQASGGELTTQIQSMISNMILEVAKISGELVKNAPQLIATGAEALKVIMQGITTALPVVLATAGQIIESFVGAFSSWLPQLIPAAVLMIVTLAQGLVSMLPQLIDAGVSLINGLVSGISAAIPVIVEALPRIMTTLLEALSSAVPQLIDAGMNMLLGLINGLVAALPTLAEMIPRIITTVVTTLVGALPQLIQSGTQVLQALVNGLMTAIPLLAAMLPTIIQIIIGTITSNLPLIIDAGLNLLMTLVNGIMQAIPLLVDMLPQVITSIVDTLVTNLPLIIEAGIQLLVGVITGIVKAIPQLVAMLPQIITTVVTILVQNIPKILAAGVAILGGLISGLIQALPSLKDAVVEIPKQIVSFLGNIPHILFDSGKKIIQGLIDGVKSMFSSVTGVFSDLLGKVRQFLPFSPAKKGPFSGKGWTLYSGRSIVEALAVGAQERRPLFESAIRDTIAAGQDQIALLESGALRVTAGLGGAAGLARATVTGPSYVVVRDSDDKLVGRMRVEASGVVSSSLAPATRGAMRELIGF